MERNYWKEYWDNYYNFMAVYLSELQEAYPDIDIKSKYIEVANLFEPGRPMQDREDQYNDGNQQYNNDNQQYNDEQYNNGGNTYLDEQGNEEYILPGGQYNQPFTSQGPGPVISTGGGQSQGQFMPPQESQTQGPGPAISVPNNQSSGQFIPSEGQFTPYQGGQSQNPNPAMSIGAGQVPGQFISPDGGQFTINNCRRMAIVRIVMRGNFNPSSFYMVVDRADRRSIQGFRIACEGGRIRFVPMAVEYRNINFIECLF